MDERIKQLTEIFCDVFGNDGLVVTEETNIEEIDGWDSFAHMSLMAAIQEEFGIQYDIDEMTEMKVVSDIISSLDGKS